MENDKRHTAVVATEQTYFALRCDLSIPKNIFRIFSVSNDKHHALP